MILNFAQECYYLENKVGVVDFTKARGMVKFQSPRALAGPWALKHYHSLGVCKIYYSHFIFEVMYHCLLRTCFYLKKASFMRREEAKAAIQGRVGNGVSNLWVQN